VPKSLSECRARFVLKGCPRCGGLLYKDSSEERDWHCLMCGCIIYHKDICTESTKEYRRR